MIQPGNKVQLRPEHLDGHRNRIGTVMEQLDRGVRVHWPYDNTCKSFRPMFTGYGLRECCISCFRERASVPTGCGNSKPYLETVTPEHMLVRID